MILIDNAVELTLKTYLGLPSRITGIKIGRDKLRDIGESFPKLLDAIEHNADDKLTGIDLGHVEWYHRLRNELYHQGNGLTVERQKVVVYAELAKLLIKNLFGLDMQIEEDEQMELLGAFMMGWQRLERALRGLAAGQKGTSVSFDASSAMRSAKVDGSLIGEFTDLRKFRSLVVHGQTDRTAVTREMVERVDRLANQVEKLKQKERA